MNLLAQIGAWTTRRPQRIAYRSKEGTVTYRELWERSDVLASWIVDRYGDDRAPIAVFGHKEPDMLTCFLACAKAGRAYVPIDASQPTRRLEQIIESSQARALLAPGALPHVAVHERTEVVRSSALEAAIACGGLSSRLAGKSVGPADDFYVMYTSGSTGAPKGVRIPKGNVESFLDWGKSEFAIPEGQTYLNQVPFSFDVSVMDTYQALSSGGSIVAVDRGMCRNPALLFDYLAASPIEVWVSTPSFLEMCLAHPRFGAALLPQLRKVLLCGETLPSECARRVLSSFPGVRLFNTYGPTEATVAITSIEIDARTIETYPSLPIGYPKPDCRVAVVDDDGRPARPGERGEIVIEGPSVSPGYLGAPELTARAFYWRSDGGRMRRGYKTGDIGYERDGMLFFAGRRDAQIKLHGHRIEIEEIETHLRALGFIDNAIVLPQIVEGRCQSLTAFLLCGSGGSGAESQLIRAARQELKARLPAYMIPQRFVVKAAFPTTINGKVNRSELAAEVAA